ncbi:MAG: hypothetical protein IJD11_01480 [Oscillospiraceae bacterium]|nr:hypothetical protein [Oscillospiraceae bacterium]
MRKKQIINDLTVGNVTPVLLKFAYPVMLANLLQTVYNMVDMVIVGQVVGSTGLSAVSIGGDIMHLFTFFGMGFATAGQIMISQYVGAGKRKELNEVIGTLFTFVLSLGLLFTFISIVFAKNFLVSKSRISMRIGRIFPSWIREQTCVAITLLDDRGNR